MHTREHLSPEQSPEAFTFPPEESEVVFDPEQTEETPDKKIENITHTEYPENQVPEIPVSVEAESEKKIEPGTEKEQTESNLKKETPETPRIENSEQIQQSAEQHLSSTELSSTDTVPYSDTLIARFGRNPAISSIVSSSEKVCDFLSKHGILFKTERIGRGNKPITVYKWQTMENGRTKEAWLHKKFGIGPRESLLHNFLRMAPDELPQIINILKGEMNFIGLRALDTKDHAQYPEDLQRARAEHAALVNCAYADKLPSKDKKSDAYKEAVIASERKFLQDVAKHPLRTKAKIAAKIFLRMGNLSFFGLQ